MSGRDERAKWMKKGADKSMDPMSLRIELTFIKVIRGYCSAQEI